MPSEILKKDENKKLTNSANNSEKNILDKSEVNHMIKRKLFETSLGVDNGKASNSCVLCRKLKKKCSKDLPACKRCVEKNVAYNCFYPGKSRRRTKVEMEQYRLEHPELAHKKQKKTLKKHEMEDKTSESRIPNAPQAKPVSEDNSDFSPLSTVNIAGRIQPAQGVGSPLASYLYNALMGAGEYARNNLLQVKEISPVPYPTVQPPQFNPKNIIQNKSFQATSPMSWPAQNSINASIPKTVEASSVPISVDSIQYETVKAIFKGGILSQSEKKYTMNKDLVTRAIMAYFRHNHRTYPMIDKIKFQERVFKIDNFEELISITDDDQTEIFKFMVFFMLAIGSTTLHRAGTLEEDFYGIAEYFSYLGMQRFQIVMKYQNMDTIRCLILLGVYSFFEPKGISSWTIGGIICRLCIGLGLNKQLTGKKKLSSTPYELELRNRCYWSTFCFEKLVHLSLLRGDGGLDVNDCNIPLQKPL